MSGQLIGSIVPWLILVVIVIAIAVYLINWLYRRSSKEIAFVRTGLGGERVVIDGGAFVLPIVHQVTDVNMNVLQLRIVRENEEALISKDRIRVDIEADFYVRVSADKHAVSAAASTLGRRTLEPERLNALLDGKLVSALRTAAVSMTMEEMHEQRGDYIARVRTTTAEALSLNGLELETVAIINLDQSGLEFFNPSNRFDAEGLTNLIQETEGRRKLRNDIEQGTMIQIRLRNLEAERQALDIERDTEMARLLQQREVESRRAEQRAEVARDRAAYDAEAQQAEIRAKEQIERSRIENDQSISLARITSEHDIRQLEIDRQRVLQRAEISAHEETERSRIDHDLALTKARIAKELETERVDIEKASHVDQARIEARLTTETARIAQELKVAQERISASESERALEISRDGVVEEADIKRREQTEQARIALERTLDGARIGREVELHKLEISRERTVEETDIDRHVAIHVKSLERYAAQVKAEAARAMVAEAEERVSTVREMESVNRRRKAEVVIAEKEADQTRILAGAEQVRAQIRAEAQRLINEAENVLSDNARLSLFRKNLLEKAEGIIRESVRPMEKIDSIRIVQFDGLTGGRNGEPERSLTDEVIDSALRYRVQAPMLDGLLKEIGFEGGSIAKMGGLVRDARDIEAIRKDVERRTPGNDPGEGPATPK